MKATKFHLGWFTGFSSTLWQAPFSDDGRPWSGQFFVELAKTLERSFFDLLMFEDDLAVSETYGGNPDFHLKSGFMSPKGDPVLLSAVIGASTSKLGIVSTMSTLAYPPYLLARTAATLDNMCNGRFGWNVVTSAGNLEAQNFGLDALTNHADRYDMAEEYVDLVCRLWGSWDQDALVLDRETGVYADPDKVRAINFKGKYYSSRGPLNMLPPPLGRPALFQAGASPRGREFAARVADCTLSAVPTIAQMKEFRADIRRRVSDAGRDPNDVKVLFIVHPFVAETESIAKRRHEELVNSQQYLDQRLAFQSMATGIDFSKFDLDAELPNLESQGSKGTLENFAQGWNTGKTLRQLTTEYEATLNIVGTPDQVADRLAETMEEVGGDGFLIMSPYWRLNRQYITEICDGLVPALQRRGLVRTAYEKSTLRETLLEF